MYYPCPPPRFVDELFYSGLPLPEWSEIEDLVIVSKERGRGREGAKEGVAGGGGGAKLGQSFIFGPCDRVRTLGFPNPPVPSS